MTPTDSSLLVVCLCAQWCRSCEEYRPVFFDVEKSFPGAKFLWIDIEDCAELIDPVEIENFPTLLIADGPKPRFFGPVPPHPAILVRLLQSEQADELVAIHSNEALIDLISRLSRIPKP